VIHQRAPGRHVKRQLANSQPVGANKADTAAWESGLAI
jgi:hypothetical protein